MLEDDEVRSIGWYHHMEDFEYEVKSLDLIAQILRS